MVGGEDMDDKTMLYIAGATATIVVGILAAIINVVLNLRNIRISKEERFIDTINAERVKWINTVRDAFSEYLKLTNIQMNDFHKWQNDGVEDSELKEIRKRSFDITYSNNQIYLLLNHTEPVIKKLLELQKDITNVLCRNNITGFSSVQITNWAEDVGYLQQVILKAEWRRVKEENKIGTEITDERMNEIYMSTAQKMDSIRFERLGFQPAKKSDDLNKTKESKRYKYLHWMIRGYTILALLIVLNMFLSGIHINCLSIFGSKQMDTLITLAGFLFTMLGLIPIIEEKYKQK